MTYTHSRALCTEIIGLPKYVAIQALFLWENICIHTESDGAYLNYFFFCECVQKQSEKTLFGIRDPQRYSRRLMHLYGSPITAPYNHSHDMTVCMIPKSSSIKVSAKLDLEG